MGIDIHGLNLLLFVRNRKPLGDTITIGRQGLHLSAGQVKDIVGISGPYEHKLFCEDLLTTYLQADVVDSVDFSDYEEATHIHDMSEPIPDHLANRYDTVMDYGTSEHVYNLPQVFENYSRMLRPGGQIVHVLPANNFTGHGFWQFSPELFFSLYSTENGYAETEVFIADLSDETRWYRILPPRDGQRINIESHSPLYALVRTVRQGDAFDHGSVQQSDYTALWESSAGEGGAAATPEVAEPVDQGVRLSSGLTTWTKAALRRAPLIYKIVRLFYHHFNARNERILLSGSRDDMIAGDIRSFVDR